MKSMIVEVCFVEATVDVALYKKVGADTVGKAIAESIANKKVAVVNTTNKEVFYRVIAGSYREKANAERIKAELESKGVTGVFLEAFTK